MLWKYKYKYYLFLFLLSYVDEGVVEEGGEYSVLGTSPVAPSFLIP